MDCRAKPDVIQSLPSYIVNLLSGPPVNQLDDARMVHDFTAVPGKRIVCGGTSAAMVARVLNVEIITTVEYVDPDIPPTAQIQGIDLVTEGVLTITKAVALLREYACDHTDVAYFHKLDRSNGVVEIVRILLENCTDLNIFIGRAMNPAHKVPEFSAVLSIKIELLEELGSLLEKMGKNVRKFYY